MIFTLILSLFSYCDAIPRKPVHLNPKNPDAPDSLSQSKSVLIIGGGLAGLSAALELSERGYDVTIRESNEVCGGRVEGRKKKLVHPKPPLTEFDSFNIEHGFHAWFHNYYTLKDIRDRLDINDNFRPWDAVKYIFRDYKPESIASEGPYPINILKIMLNSPNLRLDQAIKSTLSLPDLMFFNYKTIAHQYDNITFYEWAAQKHVDKTFFDIIMQPAMSVTLNDPEVISAATMLTFMQLYFLSDPDADKREVSTSPFNIALINPWLEHLRKFKVKIELNSPVEGLVIKNGQVISTTDRKDEIYDHVVLAADIPGVLSILKNSVSNDEKSFNVVKTLYSSAKTIGLAPPYKVMRVFFKGQLNDSRPDILETPQHRPFNLIARYDLLEDEFQKLRQEKNVTCIEFHMYTIKKEWVGISDPLLLWKLASPVAFEIYPELEQMETVGFTLGEHYNFPSYAKGLESVRPKTGEAYTLGLKNLALAGDWIKTDYPSALMERATITGREAANHILFMDNVRQAPLVVANNYGPGPF